MTREELEIFLMETLVRPLERERDAIEQKIAEKDRELQEDRKAKDRECNAREKIEKENEALKKALEDERNKNNNKILASERLSSGWLTPSFNLWDKQSKLTKKSWFYGYPCCRTYD